MPANAFSDAAAFTLTVLPSPKRLSYVRTLGLCGGFVVGHAEGARYIAKPHWWPNGAPQPIELPRQKYLELRSGSGLVIPGFWRKPSGGYGGAVGFRLAAGTLKAISLHPRKGWDWTAAIGAGGGCFTGYGRPSTADGERAVFWTSDASLVELPGGESIGHATDGAFVAGRTGRTGRQQAALWPGDGSSVIVLGDGSSVSEANAVADGEQVGVRWDRRSSAALWHGTPASYVDLTPRGFEAAWAWGCARGVQVGLVLQKEVTRTGASNMATRAALWTGTADSFVDLHACVPAPWNASHAVAVEVAGGIVRVAGTLTQVGIMGPATPHESQFVAAQQAAIWEAKSA